MQAFSVVSFVFLFAGVVAYPTGGPCGRLVPNHGGPIENDGTFDLVFRPALIDGTAVAGKNYTITLGDYKKAVPRGLAVSVSQGDVAVPTECAEECKSPSKLHAAFVHHQQPSCKVVIIWAPEKKGDALFDYTVLKKYTEWVNIQKTVKVVEADN